MSDERTIMVQYPFVVCDGEQVATLRLPKYLSGQDAERLMRFIGALTLESVTERGNRGHSVKA